jgi:hypothetical protein
MILDKDRKTVQRVPETERPNTLEQDAERQNQGHNTKKQALGPNTKR